MTRCPHCRGTLYRDAGRVLCLLCSRVYVDRVTLADQMGSAATPERAYEHRDPLGPRVAAPISEETLARLGPEWRDKLAGRAL